MEDLGTAYLLIEAANKVTYNPAQLYYYYQRTDSILHTPNPKFYKDKYYLAKKRFLYIKDKYPNCIEICRRFLADKKDFETLDFAYRLYTNENIDIHDLSNILLRDALKFFNVGQSETIAIA